MTLILISIGLLSFFAAVLIAPVVRRGTVAVGLIDRPDGERKLHSRVVPLGGGIVVFIAILIGLSLASLVTSHSPTFAALHELSPKVSSLPIGIMFAALFLFAVGVMDDKRGLRGRQKLVGQAVAATIAVQSGLLIQHISLFDWRLDLGIFAVPFTVIWLLGAINALNLIDGADGLATTIGMIASSVLAVMAAMNGSPAEAILAASLAGALAGFLMFNFPPATMFLGDTGSMLIGLIIGVLAIRTSLKGPATVALSAPIAILTIPFLDTTAAFLRRSLTGRSIYLTDRGHLHHVLLQRGLSGKGMLLCVAVLCGITAGGALISTYVNNESVALVSCGGVIATLVVFRVFGHAELLLTSNRIIRFAASLLSSAQQQPGIIRQQTVRLQGSRNWDELWNALTDFAERHGLSKVELELNIAWLHEGFHSTWECPTTSDARDIWSTKLPVAAFGKTVGRLTIAGPLTKHSIYTLLSLLAEMLETLEPCMQRLAEELPSDPLVPHRAKPANRPAILLSKAAESGST